MTIQSGGSIKRRARENGFDMNNTSRETFWSLCSNNIVIYNVWRIATGT